MTEKDFNKDEYIKQTRENLDYVIKEATKDCEDEIITLHGVYDTIECICENLNNREWTSKKIHAKQEEDKLDQKSEESTAKFKTGNTEFEMLNDM